MIEISMADRIILKKLYIQPQYHSMFYFHKHYNLTPGETIIFMTKFSELGVIASNSNKFKLTQYGKLWILSHRATIFFRKINYWKSIPEEFKGYEININEPYLPSRNKLDKKLYK